jgi:hypothetical protein
LLLLPSYRPEKGSDTIGAFLLCLVIVVDDRLAAIAVSIFFLNHGRAVPWLSLLDHGRMIPIPIPIAVLIVRLANRYASADRADVNADLLSQRGRRDSDNHGGSK